MAATKVAHKISESLKERGLLGTLARAPGFVSAKIIPRLFHKQLWPSLRTLWRAAGSVHISADELLLRYFLRDDGPSELRLLKTEYAALRDELDRRCKGTSLAFPEIWALGESSAFVLYAAVRTMRPATVLETGVANGASSFFCLNALMKNGSGTLYSVDLVPEVGGLLSEEERRLWRLTVLDVRHMRQAFADAVRSLPAVDLFVQDSDHRYPWQSFELNTVCPRMAGRSLILADDAEMSFAFLDFSERLGSRPVFLLEARKVTGLIFRGFGEARLADQGGRR